VIETNAAYKLLESRIGAEAALEKLPPNSREVLILRELEGMSYKEIADITRANLELIRSV
jgi:RNA polymerase sigma factor (sigma-70 family)